MKKAKRAHAERIKISIIIPTYNEEKNIRKCLKPLETQDFSENYEVIVSDGYSTDKTTNIAKSFGAKVVFERKRTIAAGRQKGALAARGEFLAFTDADSVADGGWLREALKPFDDERVVCIFGPVKLIHGSQWQNAMCSLYNLWLRVSLALGLPSGAGINLVVRARAFEKIEGFNTELVTGEDIDLQKRLQKTGLIVFARNAIVWTSIRRLQKWGFARFFRFHAINWLRTHFLKSRSKEYEMIR